MRNKYFIITICLTVSLLIYLFYRTEHTVVIQIFQFFVSEIAYFKIRESIVNALPLNHLIVYSLPEGLWVFCATLASKKLFLKIGSRKIDLIYMPLIYSVGLELLQLFDIIKGRFDFWDIACSIVFWALAAYFTKKEKTMQNLFNPFNFNSVFCILIYSIVYLSHVCA